MIYILLKSQDVSKLNTKGNIPVEFPKVKKGLQNVKPNFSVFFKFKNNLKVTEPLEFHLSLLTAYKLMCACIINSLFPVLTFKLL